MLIIGSIFPVLFSLVLFFGVLISAEDDDGGSGSSSTVTGMTCPPKSSNISQW